MSRGDMMVAQDPTVMAHGDDLLSIQEMPGDVTDISRQTPKATDSKQQGAPGGPQPKTDKPRPHVCTTCGRSFARLEHLKRHERSHTKEKPFECPECTRCFARRDLLLRHQQKLHMTAAPSRPRNTRRESTGAAGAATNRVRKNSIAGGVSSSMRPRANTISHVDNTALGMINAANANVTRAGQTGHTYHPSLSSVSGAPTFENRGFSSVHPPTNGLPKLETSGLPADITYGLRTAPVYGSFDMGFGDNIFGGSTINPAQLHFGGSPQFGHDTPASPFNQAFHPLASIPDPMLDDEGNFDWVNGFDTTVPLGTTSDSAIEESSPSAMSTESQSRTSEPMLEAQAHIASSASWQSPFPATQSAPYTMEFSSPTLQDLGFSAADTVSPKSLMTPIHFTDPFASNLPVTPMSQSMLGGHSQSMFSSSMVANGESPNPFNVPFASSPLRNSFSTASPDTVTDSNRQTLLANMSQTTGVTRQRFSQPSNGTTYNRDVSSRSTGLNSNYLLPNTFDLQRYIQAYITYFHPHLPFLHIPTLDFQSPEFTNSLRTASGHLNLSSTGVAGGGGCLVLSMAAMGALYEFDMAVSKDLFESAKKMIQLYLEERRKADMSAALSRSNTGRDNPVHNTPLWLVQAMLLNVIYGHTCGDKTSADIASTHCAALVSLARTAELTHHLDPEQLPQDYLHNKQGKPDDADSVHSDQKARSQTLPKERRDWLDWKIVEERKRTLYAIFTLSSLLVSAYNHAPALTNSEIRLDLPCEEDLWAAESPQAWRKMGGASSAKKEVSFSSALTTLLTASQREQFTNQSGHAFGSAVRVEDLPQSDLKPSTFGCLVLIHAMHNYIWETRQRHMGRQWTAQETDAMQAHIEPALRAWQAAWASNPLHSLERPNPFGAGPLSADSIPLLDLAYVRLFVNLGRSKEAFWQRDWNAMSDELARGAEIIQHADDGAVDHSNNNINGDIIRRDSIADLGVGDLNLSTTPTQEQPISTMPQMYRPGQLKRERLLRKAAFYAADSICMSDRLGNTFAEWTSRELPLQCAMCSFDCAQVLAEWITTVQERVGPYLGVLGRDEADLTQVPGIMLLEDEDCKLIDKIKEILGSSETKMQREAQNHGSASSINALQRLPSVIDGGYGSKILMTTAHLLDRAAVWPITKLMARSLETQATRMKERAENSIIIS